MPGRRSIDLLSTLPVAIPGLVIGVAYLWAWIGLPGGLYGTIWILALAFIARFMPDTMKALSTSLLQIQRELEEAAWICGEGLLGTIRTIVLPLARPGVVAAMTLLFILAIRELGSSLFLYTSDTMVMAVLLLDYYEGGNIGKTAAFSLVQTAILLAVLHRHRHLAFARSRAGSALEQDNKEEYTMKENVAAWPLPRLAAGQRGPPAGAAQNEFGPRELIEAAEEGRQAHLLHGELRRGRAGGHQGLQQALSRDEGRDGARAGRPAHHPHQDRGGGRQARRRRHRPLRPRR